MEYPLDQSSWQRARRDTASAFNTVWFWLYEVGIGAGLTILVLQWTPPFVKEVGGWELTVYQVLVPLGGVIVGLGVLFLIKLKVAPYKQRNEARALLQAKPKPIPLENRKELRGAIASVENATIQLVNRQDVLDKATAQNSSVVDAGAIVRRDKAYAVWDEALNELRRQYLIAGDKYESVCVDLTGFIWGQVWIKTGQIKYPEGDKPIVIHDILRFVGVLAGRVKDTLRKIEEISGQALDMEGSQT